MEIKFQPIGDYILVKQDDTETKTKTGLVLTTDSVEAPKRGEVIKLGTAKEFITQAGYKVYWAYGHREIKLDDITYLLIKEEDLMGYEESN